MTPLDPFFGNDPSAKGNDPLARLPAYRFFWSVGKRPLLVPKSPERGGARKLDLWGAGVPMEHWKLQNNRK